MTKRNIEQDGLISSGPALAPSIDWSVRARLTATPRDGGKVLHATLNASNKTTQGKLDWLLSSLRFQAKQSTTQFDVEVYDPMSGRKWTTEVGA